MMATKKEVLLHFMLFINEDFDDDLLQDALELLEEEFFWLFIFIQYVFLSSRYIYNDQKSYSAKATLFST